MTTLSIYQIPTVRIKQAILSLLMEPLILKILVSKTSQGMCWSKEEEVKEETRSSTTEN